MKEGFAHRKGKWMEFLWKIARLKRALKRKLKKIIPYTKYLLKSNKFTYRISKKIWSFVGHRGEAENKPVSEIIKTLCTENEYAVQQKTVFKRNVSFSILVPLFNTSERFLREMIESVIFQSYEQWELCLADGSDDAHKYVGDICQAYGKKNSKIRYVKLNKNRGISENTNACIEFATGEYIVLFDHDDFMHPSALFETAKAINETAADFIYTDEAIFRNTNIFDIVTEHIKPDFSPDNLRANNYICHLCVFSKHLLQKIGLFRAECDGSQDHDMILRLTEVASKIHHIPKILYYWRSHSDSVAGDISSKQYAIDGAKRAISDHLNRLGLSASIESTKIFPTFYRLRYDIEESSKVSIIINSSGDKKILKKCISSIEKKSTYKNYEIILACEEEISKASGNYLLFYDARNIIITPEWIEELLMYAQRKDVAVTGAKILYPDDSIFHGGISVDADLKYHYEYRGADRDEEGYMGRLYYSHNVSAVSGVCMMIKTSTYKKLGGIDTKKRFEDSVVELCIKAIKNGFVNVLTPYCQIYYYNKHKGKKHES